VRRDKQNAAPKIRVEHVRMSDQQRTSKAQRHPLPEITHIKLERPSDLRASAMNAAQHP
jgi:hypothetical protein